MSQDPHVTVLSQEAFQFKDVFALKFARTQFGEQPKRRLKLAEPEMSTDGGRKARQSIAFVTEGDENARTLVCGWLDVPKKVAELRSYNLVNQQFEARHGGAVDITREDYERGLTELQGFLKQQKFESTVIDAAARPARAAEAAPVEPQASPVFPMVAMLMIGVVIGFGVGYLVFGLHVLGVTA